MTYELIQKPAILSDFFALPPQVRKRIQGALERLRVDPFRDPNVKKIAKHKYSNLYRYRIGDYRLVYAVGTGFISILAVGARNSIYERLQVDPKSATELSGDLASAKPRPFRTTPYDTYRPHYPEESYSEAAASQELAGTDQEESEKEEVVDRNVLLRSLLPVWGIDDKYHDAICNCVDAEELLSLEIPDQLKERILYFLHPATADELEQQPNYELERPEQIEEFIEGSLKEFLLKLDPEQEKVASATLRGPALVKGGPGTGKSLVALYRIRNLLRPSLSLSLFEQTRPRILFVTYTTSLISACEQLLNDLLDGDLSGVDVTNLDKIVRSIIVETGREFRPAEQEVKEKALERALEQFKPSGRPFEQAVARATIWKLRPDYLIDEFDWVIEGRNLANVEEYLAEDRTGRGIGLNERARRAVWELHEQYTETLRSSNQATWDMYRNQAAELLQSGESDFEKYDAVIIDEAQDLTPAGLKACVHLCKDPKGLYLTADASQSIYNKGFAWSKVHDMLAFRGRTTILRRNYRCTKQIGQAAVHLLAEHGGGDMESLAVEPVHEGPRPLLAPCFGPRKQVDRSAELLTQWAKELRMSVSSGAVLVRTNSAAKNFAEGLQERGIPARHVHGRSLDLDEPAVKVMTLHSAKGLEFPFVVVAGVDKGVFPKIPDDVTDEEIEAIMQENRRLLFVGLSRAMRRLAVVYDGEAPSPLIRELDITLWDVN